MSDYNDLIEALTEALEGLEASVFLSPAEMLRPAIIAVVDDATEENVFIGTMPNSPDLCVGLFDTGGGEQDDREALDRSSLQVRARGSYADAHKMLAKIKLALQSVPKVVLFNGSTLIGIWVRSNIAHIGRDSQDREIFTCNFRIIIEPLQTGNRK